MVNDQSPKKVSKIELKEEVSSGTKNIIFYKEEINQE